MKFRACLILLVSLQLLPGITRAQTSPETTAIHAGMSEASLLAAKGTPESRASLGKKTLYRFRDMKVTVVDGQVTAWTLRDPAAEQAEAQRRQQVQAQAEAARQAEYSRPALPAYDPPSQNPPAPIYLPGPRTQTKAEQLALLRIERDRWQRIKDRHFSEISLPRERRSVSDAQRDLADANLTKIDAQIADLERP